MAVRWAGVGVAAYVLVAAPGHAGGHGRPPYATFISSFGDRVAVQTTFGLVVRGRSPAEDDTWRWICLAATETRALEDPPAFWLNPEVMVLPGVEGLRVGTQNACAWRFASDALASVEVLDGRPSPWDGASAYAVTSRDGFANAVHRTVDGGRTWRPTSTISGDRFETVRLASGRPGRIYVAGASSPWKEPLDAVVYRSDDGGQSWRRLPFSLRRDERNLHLLGVDPVSADHVLARVVGSGGERVVKSVDAGESFGDLVALPSAVAFAWHPSGRTAFLSGPGSGLWRSTDGADTFEVVRADLDFRCLAFVGEALWGCGGEETEFAVSSSTDLGETFEEVVVFPQDIAPEVPCAPETDVGLECPTQLDDLRRDLGLDPVDADAGSMEVVDMGSAPPAPSGCTVQARGPRTMVASLVVVAAARRQNRMRRRSKGPARRAGRSRKDRVTS